MKRKTEDEDEVDALKSALVIRTRYLGLRILVDVDH